jgi:hypothetical protein
MKMRRIVCVLEVSAMACMPKWSSTWTARAEHGERVAILLEPEQCDRCQWDAYAHFERPMMPA